MGIIDYLRKYTFDKKMESKYKEYVSGIKPTIVQPMFYKNRFRDSMSQYFMSVHVTWYGGWFFKQRFGLVLKFN